jgi:alpha-L-fucosidase
MKTRGAFSIHLMILGASAALALGFGSATAQTQPTSYTADWSSVDQHPPAAEWFQDAKLGIWFHWGAHTTPQFYGEWYPYYMYDKSNGGGVYQHHLSTYGDPFSNWPYDKFITGANDKSGNFVQFAPKLVSAGGKWDPDAWAQLFVNAGARIAGVQMEHHDGFALWDSKANEWNSLSKGPKLNLAKLHVDAFRKRGLKIMAAFHHAYNFQGYWQNAPKQTDPGLQKLYGQLSAAAENQLWLDELKEVVDEFQPDMIYQDSFTPQIVLTSASLLQFAAYYYNAALSWKKEVVETYKDGYDNKGEVYDYERGGPADISNPYWATDDTVGPNTWGYVVGMTYYDAAAIIHQFIDRVSKNGNLLLNICPMADGTIPKEQQDILLAMGTFLKQFGTAIYETRAWTVYGEGPTKMGGCSICAPTLGTAQDVRYTRSKDGDAVYAILLGWPGNGKQVNLTSVTASRFAVGSGKVFLFSPVGGSATSLQFTQDSSGLHVTLPSAQPYTAIAYAMKISKTGTEPAPTPWLASDTTDAGVPAWDAGVGSADVAVGAGGSLGTGGRSGAGGASGTTPTSSGGATATGGSVGTGGRSGAGGAAGTTPTSSGGAAGTGGSGGSSGPSASGGSAGNADAAVSTGGSNASGGRGTGGMSTGAGGSGHGGSAAGGVTGSTSQVASSPSGCSCDIQARAKSTAANPLLFLGIVVAGGICRRRFAALGSGRRGRR